MKKFFKKVFVYLSILTIVVQSLSPLAYLQLTSKAYAQEATPTPTVTSTPTPTDTVSPTPTPTDTATPTPTDTITPTPTDTPVPSDTASPTPTPTPTDTPAPTDTPPVDNLSPPPSSTPTDNPSPSAGQVQGDSTSPSPSSSPTVSPSPSPEPATGNEQINMIILKNISAPSLDLQAVNTYGSATLTTDKADYAPTDTALITGTGYNPGETYTLLITSVDSYSFSTSVTADSKGDIAYAYQLDGTYRPTYTAQVKDSTGAVVATTTFTDSDHHPDYQHWADKSPANWQNGALQSTNSQYFEGEVVPQYWKVDNLDNGHTYGFNIYYDYRDTSGSHNNCGFDYLAQYDGSRSPSVNVGGSPSSDNAFPEGHGNFYTYGANVTSVSGPFNSGDQRYVQVTFNATNSLAVFYWGLHLALPGAVSGCQGSHAWTGASLQTNVDDSPNISNATDLGGGGTLQINPDAVIQGIISGYKWNDLDGSGSLNGAETKLSGWTIRLCSDSSCNSILQTTTTDGSGNYSFNVTPGTYYVGEVQQAGWTKTTPSGNTYGPLTVNATTPTFSNQNFGNRQQLGSITIVKDAVPNDAQDFAFTAGGGLSPTNFSLDDDGDNSNTLSNTKVFSNLGSGTYSVSEGAVTGWTSDGGVCSDGSPVSAIALQAGESVTCTFTNTRDTGNISFLKVVSGGTAVPADWTFTISGGNGTAKSGDTKTYPTGSYTVTESGPSGYTLTGASGVCSLNPTNGVITLNVTTNGGTCTIANTRDTGNLKVHKVVDDNSSLTQWSFALDGGNPIAANTNGDVDFGQVTTLDTHSIVESGPTGYTLASVTGTNCSKTSSNSGSATVSKDGTTTCTFTNNRDKGTIVVHKDVRGPNGENITDTSNNFKVSLDAGTGQDITDNGTVTFSNVPTGNHTITESLVASGYTLYGIGTTAGVSGNTSGLSVSVTTGNTTDVYVTNRQNPGTITVVKTMLNGDGQAITTDTHSFTVSVGTQSGQIAYGTNANFTVNPGTYTVSESDDVNYTELGCTLVTGAPATNFSVLPGGQVTVTCTNQQIKAHITVNKNVLAPDGTTDVSDNHAFTAELNGGNDQSFSEATSAAYLVNPGSYSITELPDNNYDYVSCTPDNNQTAGDGAQVTVGSNGSATITCVNKQHNATVTIVKDVRDPNGVDVSDTTHFTVKRGGSDSKDFWEGSNATYSLAPGTYTFTEEPKTGYTLHSINPDNDADVSNGTTVTLLSGQPQTITFTNYQNFGSISGQKLGDTDGNLNTTNDQTNLADWVIKLYTCTASDFLTCVLSATTSTNGSGYSFLNVIPGFYQVQEVLQAGWTNLTTLFQNLTVGPGETKTSVNFVNFQNVSVTACKKVDADGNIATTGDQTNKFGWTVNLLTDGDVSNTQTTGENGCYTWTNLGPNHTYGVSEGTPAGWTNLTDTSHSFGTTQGGSQYTYTFVNFQNITISGHKFNDLDGNGTWDNGEPALSGWTINLSGTASASTSTNTNGEYSFTNLGPGTYTISEVGQTGWVQTAPNGGIFTINASSGTDVSDEDFGNQGQGTITVHKSVDRNGNGTYVSGDGSEFTWTLDGFGTNVMGSSLTTVPAGDHTVGENPVTDYHFMGWYPTGALDQNEDPYSCTNLPEVHSLPITVNVGPGGTSNFTICNARDTGTLIVHKMVDTGKGTFDVVDADANTLGFRWGFDASTPTNNTDSFGGNSTTLTTGSYDVYENSVSGYKFVGWLPGDQTDNDRACTDVGEGNISLPATVNITSGEATEVTLCNKSEAPKLTISKSNDASGNKAPGDTVGFTIIVTADETGGPADNVKVVDLLPKGFVFNSSSWKVVSNNILRGVSGDITSLLTAPVYASPGTWNLGHMDPNETLTLTYTAAIDGGQQTGTYYDNAWGQGNPVGSSTIIFANAINPGDLDPSVDPSEFVGTQVAVVNGNQAGVDYKATSTQEVLGASTGPELPSTGENTLWVIIATLMLALGAGTVLTGYKLKKKYE